MIGIVDYGMGNLRSVDKALEHVLGYTCANDVTARDRQVRRTPEGAYEEISDAVGAETVEDARGRIRRYDWDDPKKLVPTAAIWRFRELAAMCTGSPNLTLTVMAPLALSDLGAVGQALSGAPTLLKTIQDVYLCDDVTVA